MEEQWKYITCYNDDYMISDLGNVKSFKYNNPRLLKQRVHKGYSNVNLCDGKSRKSKQVHRLKAIEFVENPYNKPCVNHRDGNKLNNGYNEDGEDNLEWCTHGENQKHSYKIGTHKKPTYFLGKKTKNES